MQTEASANMVFFDTGKSVFDYPVLGMALPPLPAAQIREGYRPCAPGEHAFELVPEDSVSLLLGNRSRLILFCRACGASIIHDTSPSESADDA